MRLTFCYVALLFLAAKLCVSALKRRRRFRCAEKESEEAFAALDADDRCLIFLALFYAIAYLSWIWMSSIYRYLTVLELLAPVFVVLAVRRFIKMEAMLPAIAAAIFMFTLFFSVPIRFGRTDFADDFLRLQVPRIQELDKSVVLMSGYEPTAYVIPSFPAGTRFVRVSSTFATPGKIPRVDERIQTILTSYDSRHRLAYVRSIQEMGIARQDISPFGQSVDSKSCYEVRSRDRKENQGYLCGMVGGPLSTLEKPVPELRYRPSFVPATGVRLDGRIVGKYFDGSVEGTRARFVDILFEINGELMPVLRRWELGALGRMHLGPLSRTGNYRMIGIRDSNDPNPDVWYPISVAFRAE
jgi:hypothetical protein